MKNLVLLISVVASICCAIASYLIGLPLLVTLLFTAMSILNIWCVAAFTKWEFTDIEGNFVLIPTIVVTDVDQDLGIAWLKWGVTISEKRD